MAQVPGFKESARRARGLFSDAFGSTAWASEPTSIRASTANVLLPIPSSSFITLPSRRNRFHGVQSRIKFPQIHPDDMRLLLDVAGRVLGMRRQLARATR